MLLKPSVTVEIAFNFLKTGFNNFDNMGLSADQLDLSIDKFN